jgi:hypothetical protein
VIARLGGGAPLAADPGVHVGSRPSNEGGTVFEHTRRRFVQSAAGATAAVLLPGASSSATPTSGEQCAVHDVRAYGAKGDGVADDRGPIQAAIDTATAAFDRAPVALRNRVSSAPIVRIPAGSYRVDGTLRVGRPLTLQGDGPFNSVLTTQAAAPLLVVDNAVLRFYQRARIAALGLVGDGTTGSKPDQHGIELRYTESGNDAGIDCIDLAVEGMGGHGVHLPHNSNTARFVRVTVQTNWLDGFHFAGTFHTNTLIQSCIVRENRRGIVFDGTRAAQIGGYLYSGQIMANLVESNIGGTGPLGSTTRPGQGIALFNTRELLVFGNYFENQLNHIYGSGRVGYCTIRNNAFYGASFATAYVVGQGPPERQACDLYLEGRDNTGVVVAENQFEQPKRPSRTVASDWGTSRWGDEYPVLPVLTGTQHVLIDNPRFVTSCGGTPSRRSGYNGMDLAQQCNEPAITLLPADGSWRAGEWTGIRGQATADDPAGRVEIRFVRGQGHRGDLEVWVTGADGTARKAMRVDGDTGALELAGGVRVQGLPVLGQRGDAVRSVEGEAGAHYSSTERRMLNDCRRAINEILHRLREGTGHGLIGG